MPLSIVTSLFFNFLVAVLICGFGLAAQATSVRIGTRQVESIEIRQWPSSDKPIPTLIYTHPQWGPLTQVLPKELAQKTEKEIKAWHAKILGVRSHLWLLAVCTEPVMFTGTKEPQDLCFDLVDRDLRFGFLQWFQKTAAITRRHTK